jgi:hypothetical protein
VVSCVTVETPSVDGPRLVAGIDGAPAVVAPILTLLCPGAIAVCEEVPAPDVGASVTIGEDAASV